MLINNEVELPIDSTNLIPYEEWAPDVDEIAERCFIGPQGQLIEKIQHFNQRFTRHCSEDWVINTTKKYQLKPGTYKNIKEVYSNHINQFNMKPRGLVSLRDRISNNSWQARNFWNEVLDIENKMKALRLRGNGWVDNTDLVKEYVNGLSDKFTDQLNMINNTYPNIHIDLYIDTHGLENGINNDMPSAKLIIVGIIKNPVLKVSYDNEIAAEIALPDISLIEELDIWRHINSFCIRETTPPRDTYGAVRNTYAYMKCQYDLQHPFIHNTNHWNRHSRNTDWRGICKGDHQTYWSNALWHLDLNAWAYYLNMWSQNYNIPTTNPLNKIWKCFIGLPEGFNPVVVVGAEPRAINNLSDTEKRAKRCDFPGRYLTYLSETYNKYGLKDPEDTVDNMTNHCTNCQLKDLGHCFPVNLELYPFNKEELDWSESEYHENLDDREFMIQQIMMHYTAKDILSYGIFAQNLNEEERTVYKESGVDSFDLYDVDNVSELFEPARAYNLDASYLACVRSYLGFHLDDVIMDFLSLLTMSYEKLCDELRAEYAGLLYGTLNGPKLYDNDLSSCQVDELHDELEGADSLAMRRLIRQMRSTITVNTATSTVERQRELTIQEQMIQQSIARTGGITLNN